MPAGRSGIVEASSAAFDPGAFALELDSIAKTFRSGFRRRRREALRDVTLTVKTGEIVGLLGPNGAGKTTLFKIALGLLKPNRGHGRLLGKQLGDLSARRWVGYVPEEPYHHPALTVRETLRYSAGLSRLTGSAGRRRIEAVIAEIGLAEVCDLAVRKLSRGWLRRVSMASAILPEPRLLLLDEPLSGLDPEARVAMKTRIREWRDTGRTVLISSHILPDVERMADTIVILRDGRVIASAPCATMQADLEEFFVRVMRGDHAARGDAEIPSAERSA